MDIYRYESSLVDLDKADVPIIFLAGPTVRANQTHLTSWRIDAIEEFKRQGFDGILISPEFTVRIDSDLEKGWIPLWEFTSMCIADVIMFWVPRTKELIGLTTNFELGYWLARNPQKIVYGRPDDAYRITYPDIMYTTNAVDRGYPLLNPICHTLSDTVTASKSRAEKNRLLYKRIVPLIQFDNPFLNGTIQDRLMETMEKVALGKLSLGKENLSG